MSCPRCSGLAALAALVASTLALNPLASHAGTSRSRVEGPAQDTVQAIWRIQHFDFTYRSNSVYYACDALQRKIGAILKAVGAHHRMAIEVHCMAGRFVNYAYARVTLALPAEATRANVREATTFDAHERLIARIRKLRLPTPTDIERFPAEWQTVSLSNHRGLRLDAGDCDLLRGLREQVFPKLPIYVETGGRCLSGVATRIRPTFEVTALMPAQSEPAAVSLR